MICPKCGVANDDKRLKCNNCDADFAKIREEEAEAKNAQAKEQEEELEIFPETIVEVKHENEELPTLEKETIKPNSEPVDNQKFENVNPEGKSLKEQLYGDKLEDANSFNDYNQVTATAKNENVVTYVEPDKKKVSKGIVFLITLVIFATIGFCGWYFFLKADPYKLFTIAIEKTYQKVNNKLEVNPSIINGKFDFNLQLFENGANIGGIFDIVNKLDINTKFDMDYNNNIALYNADIKYDDDTLVNADIYVEEKKAYIYLNDLYSKFIKCNMTDSLYDNLFNKVNITQDHKNLLEESENAIIKSLKKEYFSSEKKSINVNNKEINTTKNTLSLNKDNFYEVLNNIVNYLLNSDKFVNSLAKINETTVSEVKDDIQQLLNDINDDMVSADENLKITIDIYTSGFKKEFVELDLVFENTESTMELLFTKDKANNYSYKISTQTLEEEEKTMFGTLELSTVDEMNYYKFAITYDKATVSMKIGYNLKYNNKVSKLDVTNNISYSEFKNSDINIVSDKLNNSKGFVKLSNALNKMIEENLANDENYGL